MTEVSEASKTLDLLPKVRRIIAAHLEKMAPLLGTDANVQQLAPGKLRGLKPLFDATENLAGFVVR